MYAGRRYLEEVLEKWDKTQLEQQKMETDD